MIKGSFILAVTVLLLTYIVGNAHGNLHPRGGGHLHSMASGEPGQNCGQYDLHPKPKEIPADHPHGLWPGLANKYDLADGETLVGLYEVSYLINFLV